MPRYRKHLIITLLPLLLTLPATGLDERFRPYIIPIKDAFATEDISQIAKHIRFPLKREYPLPPVTENNFAARFHEVFDDKLIQLIAQSDIDTDWSDVGWRGIMLGNGVVWVDFEDKIKHINYSTKTAGTLRAQLIAKDKGIITFRAYRVLNLQSSYGRLTYTAYASTASRTAPIASAAGQ